MLNISATGAFLATELRLRPLSLIQLEPAAAGSSDGDSPRFAASVVRQDSNGVGIEWCESSAESTTVVTRLTSLTGGIGGLVVAYCSGIQGC
jgi:hypothetical protein